MAGAVERNNERLATEIQGRFVLRYGPYFLDRVKGVVDLVNAQPDRASKKDVYTQNRNQLRLKLIQEAPLNVDSQGRLEVIADFHVLGRERWSNYHWVDPEMQFPIFELRVIPPSNKKHEFELPTQYGVVKAQMKSPGEVMFQKIYEFDRGYFVNIQGQGYKLDMSNDFSSNPGDDLSHLSTFTTELWDFSPKGSPIDLQDQRYMADWLTRSRSWAVSER